RRRSCRARSTASAAATRPGRTAAPGSASRSSSWSRRLMRARPARGTVPTAARTSGSQCPRRRPSRVAPRSALPEHPAHGAPRGRRRAPAAPARARRRSWGLRPSGRRRALRPERAARLRRGVRAARERALQRRRGAGAAAARTEALVSKRLRLNPIACDGHGLCAELLPERIRLDEWGYPIVADGPLPRELERHARRAVAACPVLALSLLEVEERRRLHERA